MAAITTNDPSQMSDELAIKVSSISKVYPLYDSPRDRLKEALHPGRKKYHHDFYALRDVSFEIKKGETMGILGRNGSGKSTLLKVLSKVLTPTSGSCLINGKVSSLLELGTGFNPELTGMENLYFNAAIQGFQKWEIDEKLDEIIAFADIGEFIHQPVKIYSSGMYVRLAFAIAINVDPEILIIDEALAVGDMRFQQKCFRKIKEFRETGKTILFCSHDIGAILAFCTSCIWLNDGSIKYLGKPDEVTNKYQAWINYETEVSTTHKKSINEESNGELLVDLTRLWRDVSNCHQFGDNTVEMLSVAFYDANYKTINTLRGGEKVSLSPKIKFKTELSDVIVGFNIKNKLGIIVFGTNTYVEKCTIPPVKSNSIKVVAFSFIFPNLGNGTYSIDIAVASGEQSDHKQHGWKYDVIVFNTNNTLLQASFGQIFLRSDEIQITYIECFE